MILRSKQFDLGLDTTRIKDQRDARRQERTVEEILGRFFHRKPKCRMDLQVLADEVGMGKTFVGLGMAYSILQAMQFGKADEDLRGCYQKALIVTPTNSALLAKWGREVGEFVKRCVHPAHRKAAAQWFSSVVVDRVDDLVVELRRPGSGPRVIVAPMSVFGGGRLQNYDTKRRHLLGVLFRYWRKGFRIEERERLLRGAPESWSGDPQAFDVFEDHECEQLPFGNDEFARAIEQLDRRNDQVQALLDLCKQTAEPYARDRTEAFADIEKRLNKIYRSLMGLLLNQALPLVVVDEAHNWKNGPTCGANGYQGFIDLIACRARRTLLLTATPFQLRPAEMLEILKIGDAMAPCPTLAESTERTARLQRLREEVIRPVLAQAEKASRGFAKTWAKLPATTDRGLIAAAWDDPAIARARKALLALARRPGLLSTAELEALVNEAVLQIDPDLRELVRQGLRLFGYNADLSSELGAVVVRHRRHTEHRLFRVGGEYSAASDHAQHRPDRHVLHAAPGLDVRGKAELPHYLLMRCVSEMKGGKGKSSLGSSLTGCYSTLAESKEGQSVSKHLQATPVGRVYLGLLGRMVSAQHDPEHPKVQKVVDAVLKSWHVGEKTLLFCFRTNTARRLHDIISERIRNELEHRRQTCMGGPEALKALRGRLTGRDKDLVGLGLDRLLWSLLWAQAFDGASDREPRPSDLMLKNEELVDLAELGLRYGVDLLEDKLDRVFLHRATEHLIARRWLNELAPTGRLKALLRCVAGERWVEGPYSLQPQAEHDDGGAETAQFDERGVHSTYTRIEGVDVTESVNLGLELRQRRDRARKQEQDAILDGYLLGPSLWLGENPEQEWESRHRNGGTAPTIRLLHERVADLLGADGDFDWESRRLVLQALRRAVLRESVLLRLLPDRADRDKAGWGQMLVQRFFAALPDQRESMADRIAVFLEDVLAASGSLTDPDSARYALLSATRLRDQQFVALVSGGTDNASRERVFAGFNTPLLPEVLICTSVGQEGIDLHRHCRHVVHFDLAWNPAALEQRTGRADRIGSKTERERAAPSSGSETFLEIGVPYLAGTYDERMYEELRTRAQTFEVLTGGALSADSAEYEDEREELEGRESGLDLIRLPPAMLDTMRVKLNVWAER